MRVVSLAPSDRQATVSVLAGAFHDYPVMRYILGAERPDYEASLRSVIGFYCDSRFVNGWPVLGIRDSGELLAATLITPPTDAPPPPELQVALARLRAEIGEAAFGRMERFEAASDANEPPGRHHFVGMLGVVPNHQGKGYGRLLLDRTRELAAAAGSAGLCLSTEDPHNLAFYERVGFRIVAEQQLESLHTWCMYASIEELAATVRPGLRRDTAGAEKE